MHSVIYTLSTPTAPRHTEQYILRFQSPMDDLDRMWKGHRTNNLHHDMLQQIQIKKSPVNTDRCIRARLERQ